jgi:hypothetical protein
VLGHTSTPAADCLAVLRQQCGRVPPAMLGCGAATGEGAGRSLICVYHCTHRLPCVCIWGVHTPPVETRSSSSSWSAAAGAAPWQLLRCSLGRL